MSRSNRRVHAGASRLWVEAGQITIRSPQRPDLPKLHHCREPDRLVVLSQSREPVPGASCADPGGIMIRFGRRPSFTSCFITLNLAFASHLAAKNLDPIGAGSVSDAPAVAAPHGTGSSEHRTVLSGAEGAVAPSAVESGPSPASVVAEATGFVDCAEGLSADAASCPAGVWLYAILDTVSQCLDGGADGADVHSVDCTYLGGGVWRYRVQATCTYNIF